MTLSFYWCELWCKLYVLGLTNFPYFLNYLLFSYKFVSLFTKRFSTKWEGFIDKLTKFISTWRREPIICLFSLMILLFEWEIFLEMWFCVSFSLLELWKENCWFCAVDEEINFCLYPFIVGTTIYYFFI